MNDYLPVLKFNPNYSPGLVEAKTLGREIAYWYMEQSPISEIVEYFDKYDNISGYWYPPNATAEESYGIKFETVDELLFLMLKTGFFDFDGTPYPEFFKYIEENYT